MRVLRLQELQVAGGDMRWTIRTASRLAAVGTSELRNRTRIWLAEEHCMLKGGRMPRWQLKRQRKQRTAEALPGMDAEA